MIAPDASSGSERSWLKSAAGAGGGALLLFTIILIADTLYSQVARIEGQFGSILTSIFYLALPASVSLSAIFLIFRCKDDKAISRVALGLLAVSVLARLIWVLIFDSYQINDFGYYLQCGADVVRTGSPAGSHFCDGPYWKRTVFYTLPIVRLFGTSLLAIKLVNVTLASLTAWFFYLGCKILFDARTAALALVFVVWNPDLWYSMTLASHDITGLFWLAIFYYFCALLQRRLTAPSAPGAALLTISLCLGVTLFFLEFSRSYHDGAIFALVLYTITHAGLILIGRQGAAGSVDASAFAFSRGAGARVRIKAALVHAAFLLLIPLAVYRLAGAGFWAVSPVQPGHGETGLTCYLSVMDVLGTSDYEEINNWYERQCPLIPGNEKTIFAVRKVLHDVTHDPREFLRHVERKNRVLGAATDYIEWATYTAYEPWDTTYNQVRRVNLRHINEQYRMVSIAEIVVLMLVLWRLVLFTRIPFRLGEVIPFSFSAFYFLLFLFLVESQPRYDIFLVFPFSWMAAQAILDLRRRFMGESAPAGSRSGLSSARVLFSGAAILAILTGVYWGLAGLIADGRLTLRDQSGFSQVPPDQIVPAAGKHPQVAPVFVRNNHKQVMLAYPPGITVQKDTVIAVQRVFKVAERPDHHLRFFISNYSVREEPFDQQITWEDTDLEYLLSVNGKVIAAGSINDIRDNAYFSLSEKDGIVFTPTVTIQLVIRNNDRIEKVEPKRGPILSLEYIDLW